jgi:hypothetical protein
LDPMRAESVTPSSMSLLAAAVTPLSQASPG